VRLSTHSVGNKLTPAFSLLTVSGVEIIRSLQVR